MLLLVSCSNDAPLPPNPYSSVFISNITGAFGFYTVYVDISRVPIEDKMKIDAVGLKWGDTHETNIGKTWEDFFYKKEELKSTETVIFKLYGHSSDEFRYLQVYICANLKEYNCQLKINPH